MPDDPAHDVTVRRGDETRTLSIPDGSVLRVTRPMTVAIPDKLVWGGREPPAGDRPE
ncbi:MAG: hypothetical protein ABEH56_06130 [Salinirussus sp.]